MYGRSRTGGSPGPLRLMYAPSARSLVHDRDDHTSATFALRATTTSSCVSAASHDRESRSKNISSPVMHDALSDSSWNTLLMFVPQDAIWQV